MLLERHFYTHSCVWWMPIILGGGGGGGSLTDMQVYTWQNTNFEIYPKRVSVMMQESPPEQGFCGTLTQMAFKTPKHVPCITRYWLKKTPASLFFFFLFTHVHNNVSECPQVTVLVVNHSTSQHFMSDLLAKIYLFWLNLFQKIKNIFKVCWQKIIRFLYYKFSWYIKQNYNSIKKGFFFFFSMRETNITPSGCPGYLPTDASCRNSHLQNIGRSK